MDTKKSKEWTDVIEVRSCAIVEKIEKVVHKSV